MGNIRLGALRRICWRWPDLLALGLLAVYAALAISAQAGLSVAGQGLDPVLAAARQRGTLRVAVDFGFAPFSGYSGGVPSGYDIDLARAVAARLGLRAEFVPSSLDAIYEDLAAGKADLAASALPYAPQQGWRARFSTFYFNAGQVLVVREGSPIGGQHQLAGRTVGVPLGSDADTYGRRLAQADPSITLRASYDTPAQVLDDLRRGAIDAAIVDNAAALTAAGRAGGLRPLDALTLEPYVLAMPATAYQLNQQVNDALEALRREGFFERNGARWFR